MENQGTNKDGYFLFNKLIINDIYCMFFALYSLGLLSIAAFNVPIFINFLTSFSHPLAPP